MGNMKCLKMPKVILVPYPAQGHVTPMIKLASAILNHGFHPILVTPEFIHRRIISSIDPADEISCMAIPDGLDKDSPRDFFALEKAMENTMPTHLERLLHEVDDDDDDDDDNGGGGIVCMVIDLLASWAIDVANRCGVPAAGFWPAMLATYRLIAAIPDMIRTGLISDMGCPQHQGTVLRFLPNQPMLSTEDLPWLVGNPSSRKARFKFWTRTMDRSRALPWLLVNSFSEEYWVDDHKLQNQQLIENNYKYSQGRHPLIFPVGPLSKHSILTKNPSLWAEDMSCLEWLDKQKPNSVIYISFGSWVSPIGETKVRNLALALEASGRPFVWVVGPNWREGLPLGYLERASKQGKLVSWAPQMQVLQHKAVGCYLTHCGWNSTMEAIQCQKRLLCYPVAGDQFVNCGYIVRIWKIGVKINGFGQKDVEEGLKKVMEDSEMSNRLTRLHQTTMGEEARSTSMATLTAFINNLNKLSVENSPLLN